jgi:hypothetical protein
MEPSSPSYSPFWPLCILVVCLGVWMGYQIVALNEERVAAEGNIRQLIPQADAALAAKKRLFSLAQDLSQAAAKDAAAAQIVSEFNIRVQNPPKPNASSTTK